MLLLEENILQVLCHASCWLLLSNRLQKYVCYRLPTIVINIHHALWNHLRYICRCSTWLRLILRISLINWISLYCTMLNIIIHRYVRLENLTRRRHLTLDRLIALN